jgi:hypothetical protein
MSRRIDIELTSDRGDGTWTWRAAGAKQPKGVVAAGLLPSGAAVGQQLRAEVETTLDGTDVLAVMPPKEKNRAAVETIELLPRGSDEPLVTQTLAGRGRGDRGDRRDRGDRGDRGDRRDRGDRGDRGDRPGGRGRDGDRRPRSDRDRGPGGPGGPGGDRPGGRGGERGARRGPGGERGAGGERGPRGDRPDRPRRERPAPPPKPKAKRLRPGRAHRKTALDVLGPEEQVIGEQLLAGGIPGLRQAIEKQNAQAKAEGTRAVSAAPLLVIAERLWPNLRAAEWRDRAEAALADIDELDLRDLRSVVVAADGGAKDEESRALATQLRDGLTARLDHEHHAWLDELATTLQEGRVVRALRLSSRPPKAGAPLPADLAAKLTEATSAALTADTAVDRWATVLDALSFSPVRLTVVPVSRPEEPSAELLAVITRMASRVPKVAEAFGVDPTASPRRGRGGKGGGKAGGARRPAKASAPAGEKRVPPPPPRPTEITTDTGADDTQPSPAGEALPVDPGVPTPTDEVGATATATEATSETAAPDEPAVPEAETTTVEAPTSEPVETDAGADDTASTAAGEATPSEVFAPAAADDAPGSGEQADEAPPST